MNYLPKLYRIIAHTNLHVGSGDQNFGIIDNLIQRDPVTHLPVIHGSSLKGALREFFSQQYGPDSDLVTYVFGAETTKNDRQGRSAQDKKTPQPGQYRFFDAHLLSMPIRSNKRPFFRATSPGILSQFIDLLDQVGQSLASGQSDVVSLAQNPPAGIHHFISDLQRVQDVLLEDHDLRASYHDQGANALSTLTGEGPALIPDEAFSTLCNDNHLPVIARNSLENGRSTNLWYEQIVPRQSVFYALIMAPEHENNHFSSFDEALTSGNLKQIGANASIGYGFCQFDSLSLTPANTPQN